MFRRIELRSGGSSLLFRAHAVMTCAGALLLLSADLETAWMLSGLLCLPIALFLVNRDTRRRHPAGYAIIHDDGRFRFDGPEGERHGSLTGQAWVSRWLCVFNWRDGSGRSRPCLVMAARNHPDDYRRLRVMLRLLPARENS